MRRLPLLALVIAATGCPNTLVVEAPGGPRGPVCEAPVARARRLSHVELRRSLVAAFPTVAVPDTAFVPDPRPDEFDNNVDALQPNSLWIDQVYNLAIQTASLVVEDRAQALPCDPALDADCVDLLIEDLGTRIFRRPPVDEERADLRSFFEESPGLEDPVAGLTLALEYLMQSPSFLYRIDVEGSAGPAGQRRVDAASLASRLSYFIWGAAPDEALLTAALTGQLETTEQIRAQAQRLLDSEPAREESLSFHAQWLDFQRLVTTNKAAEDNFSPSLKESLITEQELFVLETLFAQNGTPADLLTTREGYVNAELAELYGVPAPEGSEWAAVELPADRGGFLRRAPFLTSHAHPNNPSPILRGVFILDRLLCTSLGTPPGDADVTPPTPGGAATTNRAAVEERTAPANCQSCHALINPIGFAFEGYDTVGRTRTTDNGVAVDSSGLYPFSDESYDDASGLVDILQSSGEVETCAVRKMLTWAWGDGSGDNDCLVGEIQAAAPAGGVKDLLLAVATHESFRSFVPGPVDDAAAEDSP